ncbi:hypothetical protein [Buchnera aphidicola]|uniref:Putative transcriptional regulator, bolA family n=1 Tax=Buchnera aphidicola subsp. Cinara cedri (strain Cc) TaxID=372461 RepID=Q057J3_BUCCC|nr:hypothetical protein [Buchnera aphidicola]ABJ90706.1 putative transcriptional regulator, bolA family [Buchnera aphidicola BCc]
MNFIQLSKLIKKKLNLKKVLISNYNNNILITAIGNFFLNMSSFEKQKHIYKVLIPYFLNKTIHAVTINTYTISEWNNKQNSKNN